MTYSEAVKGSIWSLYRLRYTYCAIIASIWAAHSVRVTLGTVQYTIKKYLEELTLENMDDGLAEIDVDE
jgi:hypothetical protein